MEKEKVLYELDRLTAEQIMKWKPHYHGDRLVSFMTDQDKLVYFAEESSERDWKPSELMEQSFQVMEALRDADIYMDIKSDVEGYWLSVYQEGTHYEWENRVSLQELPKQICLTAIKTLIPKSNEVILTTTIVK